VILWSGKMAVTSEQAGWGCWWYVARGGGVGSITFLDSKEMSYAQRPACWLHSFQHLHSIFELLVQISLKSSQILAARAASQTKSTMLTEPNPLIEAFETSQELVEDKKMTLGLTSVFFRT
jgi:hypothetical protein